MFARRPVIGALVEQEAVRLPAGVLAAVIGPPVVRFSWMVLAWKTAVPPPKMKSTVPSMYESTT